MDSKYTVIIYTPQELNHSSYVQTGLFELERLGFINIRIQLKIIENIGRTSVQEDGSISVAQQSFPKTSFYKLIFNDTKESILFAVDLYDAPNQFSSIAFEKCDFIFKRNYESKWIQFLPNTHQRKLHSFGLSFGVHSIFKRNNFLFFIGLFLSNFVHDVNMDRRFFKRIGKIFLVQLKHWKFVSKSRMLPRFEEYTLGQSQTILFQTRCFLREDHKDVIHIHQQRYEIIKLVKSHFPKIFSGGFVPSEVSTDKYCDALTNIPTDPELYLDILKSAKIVIYTRGLANSPAWKMAEYLSQGKIIIAESLSTELPVPLIHGKELLFFKTNEELIKNIRLVLADDSLAKRLSKNARSYFEKHVHPRQTLERILNIMTSKIK